MDYSLDTDSRDYLSMWRTGRCFRCGGIAVEEVTQYGSMYTCCGKGDDNGCNGKWWIDE